MKHSAPIVVVGAGMAGLACARTLQNTGNAVVVLEASDRVGGRLGSEQIDGSWLDLGFQVSMSNYHALESLVPRSVVPRHAFIPGALVWTGGTHVRILDPRRSPWSALSPLRAGLVGWRDLRAAARCRRWARGGTRPGTAEDVLTDAGFGERFKNTFLRPFFGGVFLDEQLDVTADRFLSTLHRFATGRAELPAGSMQQLAEAMADPIRGSIRFGHAVEAIEPGQGVHCSNGERIETQQIVLATEFDRACELLGAPVDGSDRLWSGTMACHFSAPGAVLDEPLIALNGSGSGSVNLVCSPTAVAPGYRTDGRHSIIASLKPFAGTAPTVDPDRIADEAAAILGVDPSSWTWISNTTIEHGLPRSLAPDTMPTPPAGVHLAGDWDGHPSIETAVASGIAAAQRLCDD